MDFTHLHLHTGYSLADSSIKSPELAKRIKEMGMTSVAITDHGVLFGAADFYKECVDVGIKPIIGMETYVAPRKNTDKVPKVDDANYHLVLLCKDNTGYSNLMKIASYAAIDGFYYKPRTDKETLRKYGEGLIALSACLGGEVPSLILQDRVEEAYDVAREYNSIFGQDNFYLEIQNHKMPEQATVNRVLLKMSKDLNIPAVCTNDCHYIDKTGAVAHDILMAIQAKTTVYDSKRKKYPTDEFYLKSPQEMFALFGHMPGLIENTARIAERCNVSMEFGKSKLPKFLDIPEGMNDKDFLRDLVISGAKKIYGEITPEISERIKYELEVILNMGYVDYFLIVWDFVRYARKKGILVGPGRGSAAGSVVSYCLEITKVDPLRYDLLFERFLDPSRVSVPDIDLDFQDNRRQEVIDYVIKKYGQESVCQIITFGTMAARSAIRAVGRALNFDYKEYDEIAKMVPKEIGITLKDAINTEDLKLRYENSPRAKELIDAAMELEKLPLYSGTHPAGVLITDKKGVTAHVPVWKNDETTVSQFDMDLLEKLGLLKADFLGLSTLTGMKMCTDWIKENHNTDIDVDSLIDRNDSKPFDMISKGFTQGIFQLENEGMTHLMTDLRPETIDEIMVGISLYRPGPLQYIPEYLANKRDPEKIKYLFPETKPILSETKGILTYQEQCMKMVMALAGYQKHHSDSFRRAIAKKKADLIAIHREWFINGRPEIRDEAGNIIQDIIPGGVKEGFAKDKLEKLYGEMEKFGQYAFNKSHAAAYAIIAYNTSWLKSHYPAEFMASFLTINIDTKPKISSYINHARQDLNIPVLNPDINFGCEQFVPTKDGEIVFSLLAKSAKVEIIRSICNERQARGQFKDMYDFFRRCFEILDKPTFVALSSVGAFESIGGVRSQLLAAVDDIFDLFRKIKDSFKRKRNTDSIDSIFVAKFKLKDIIPEIKEFPGEIITRLEKEFLGVYLSGHPLDKYTFMINREYNFQAKSLSYEYDEETGDIKTSSTVNHGDTIKMVGIVTNIKQTITKEVKEKMAITQIEDKTGACKLIIFPRVYRFAESILKEDGEYKVTAEVSMKRDEPPCLFCQSIESLDSVLIKKVFIDVDSYEEAKKILRTVSIMNVSGNDPLYFRFENLEVLTKPDYWVDGESFKLSVHPSIVPRDKIKIIKKGE